MSSMGIVHVGHFKFVFRSQGMEPNIEKLRVFDQLKSNMGFFSFALRTAKKISKSPPKSFHVWNMNIFFIRSEVIPMEMQLERWARLPKKIWRFLVARHGMKARLYQSSFPTVVVVMGTRPLRDGEEFWFEQIRPNFMYMWLDAFAALPLATEGARIPNPRLCRAITFTGKEIVYLSTEELVDSLECKLSPSHNRFAGVLHNLGVDPDVKKPKRVSKNKATTTGAATVKKTMVAKVTSDTGSQKGITRFRQSNLEAFVLVADSLEDLHVIGGKPQGGATRGSGSAGSKG
ncbi:hypothetical protein Hanom_Chr12g01158801 [Helianthus anomalus]